MNNQNKDKLIEVQKAYIRFLGKDIEGNSSYLNAHGIHTSPEVVAEGEGLRADIKELEDGIGAIDYNEIPKEIPPLIVNEIIDGGK